MNEEIENALKHANPALRRFARSIMRGLGRRAPIDRDEDDLMQEAISVFICKIFAGNLARDHDHSFMPEKLRELVLPYLLAVMKNIAKEWRRKTPLTTVDDRLLRHSYTVITPERLLASHQVSVRTFRDIKDANDKDLAAVAHARADGMSPKEGVGEQSGRKPV